jgi:hypothetical protein
MGSYIRDDTTKKLVAKIHANAMLKACEYSHSATKEDANGARHLINPKPAHVSALNADELEPDNLPVATEIEKYKYLIT